MELTDLPDYMHIMTNYNILSGILEIYGISK